MNATQTNENTRLLSRLSVQGLFGDRSIDMTFHSSGITVVTGENGVGKSTALELLRCCLKIDDYATRQPLFDASFGSVTIEFSDGMTLGVIREDLGEARHLNVEVNNERVHQYHDIAESQETLGMRSWHAVSPAKNASPTEIELAKDWGLVARYIDATTDLEVLTGRGMIPRFMDRRRDWFLSIGQVAEQHKADRWPENVRSALNRIAESETPTELKQALQGMRVVSITAQRLSPETRQIPRRNSRDERKSAIADYQDLVQEEIRRSASNYSRESIRLDREFPSGLMQFIEEFEKDHSHATKQDLETTTLLNAMQSDVESFEAQMTEIGILDKANTETMTQVLAKAQSTSVFEKFLTPFLIFYYQTYQQKALAIQGFATRLLLAKELINSKLSGKELRVARESGFIVNKITDGQLLNPDELSSGEQHLIILYLKLLIELQPNSLILIDEPEISWHLSWQSAFIDELMQIQEQIPSVQFVIATHSMSILGEHFELESEIVP